MANTPFSDEQFEWSKNIHQKERDNIYPDVYGVRNEDISYDDDNDKVPENIKKFQDYEEARDITFWVKYPNWAHPMKHSAQFRIRDVCFQRFQDLTITLTNPLSGLPGELFKLQVDVFPYGYYDPSVNRLIELLVADCPKMRNGIIKGTLPYTTGINPRTKQPFIAIRFIDLKKQGMVLLHWKEIDGVRTQLSNDPPSRQVS